MLIVALSFISAIVYFMYIYYYYSEITIQSFINHTVGSINILSENIMKIVYKILSYKEAIIMISVIIIIKYTAVKEILENITNLEAGSVKVALNKLDAESKLEEIKKDSENEVSDNIDNKVKEINFKNKKIKIMKLIIDNPEIIEIIDKFMKNSRRIEIPMKLINNRYNIETISELFNYEYKSNSVKITGIKEEIKSALLDVYLEFKEKKIIYSTA